MCTPAAVISAPESGRTFNVASPFDPRTDTSTVGALPKPFKRRIENNCPCSDSSFCGCYSSLSLVDFVRHCDAKCPSLLHLLQNLLIAGHCEGFL